jgi:hypothetical protein
MFHIASGCNKNDMHLGPQLLALLATTGAGWLMIESGVLKHMLERRRDKRVCPSCGRDAQTCGCLY